MNILISGAPAAIAAALAVVVLSVPIWFSARFVGADNATLLRSVMSLIVGVVSATVCLALAGGLGILLAPICLLLSFKYILGTSFIGAIIMAVVSAAGYTLAGRLLH